MRCLCGRHGSACYFDFIVSEVEQNPSFAVWLSYVEVCRCTDALARRKVLPSVTHLLGPWLRPLDQIPSVFLYDP